ncbi:MAG: DUF2007 domain-containing protein [Prevotellaceae bacterium]|jgi:hypothetical protein|nr:DUF2007 domain-containing protein [Prevotellaceae bacterium]
MDNSKTVVLTVCSSIPQAKIIKSLLEANDIQCFLPTESEIMFGSFFSQKEIKLYVLESDYHVANEILTGQIQDNTDFENE